MTGQTLWHFTMSLDGFIAGPGHSMDWMARTTQRPGVVEEYAGSLGAVLGGRDGWDAFPDPSAIYGGAWTGPLFILTHHPEDAEQVDGVTFLDCDAPEALSKAHAAAGGKDVEVFSASVGRQLLELGLIDRIDLHVAPVLLGDGVRLYDNPGGPPIHLERLGAEDPHAAIDVRYVPTRARARSRA